jgi:hypothetical protein
MAEQSELNSQNLLWGWNHSEDAAPSTGNFNTVQNSGPLLAS